MLSEVPSIDTSLGCVFNVFNYIKKIKEGLKLGLIIVGDVHFPKMVPGYWEYTKNLIRQKAKEVDELYILFVGDIFNATAFSFFHATAKDGIIREEVEKFRKFIKDIETLPGTKIVTCGNHDNNIENYIRSQAAMHARSKETTIANLLSISAEAAKLLIGYVENSSENAGMLPFYISDYDAKQWRLVPYRHILKIIPFNIFGAHIMPNSNNRMTTLALKSQGIIVAGHRHSFKLITDTPLTEWQKYSAIQGGTFGQRETGATYADAHKNWDPVVTYVRGIIATRKDGMGLMPQWCEPSVHKLVVGTNFVRGEVGSENTPFNLEGKQYFDAIRRWHGVVIEPENLKELKDLGLKIQTTYSER